jgi:hypothetical protein
MVRAILEGRKTQTRRIVKPQPSEEWHPDAVGMYAPTCVDRYGDEYPGAEVYGAADESEGRICPYGKPGDRLWVRESHWRFTGCVWRGKPWDGFVESPDGDPYNSRCYDDSPVLESAKRSAAMVRVPSIHMPRWASRITLEITDVRMQQLLEISEEDAQEEGAWGGCTVCGDSESGDCVEHTPSYIDSFAHAWMSIHGDHSWYLNPWVWALTFRRLEVA